MNLAPATPEIGAADRRLLERSLADAPDDAAILRVLRTRLNDVQGDVRAYFLAGGSAAEVHGRLSELMDELIHALLQFAHLELFGRGNQTTGESLAVIAVGGYGRAELAPQSDIDLLFLHPYKRTPYVEQMCEYLLYKLWDLGLKVGQATRSVGECIKLANSDITIRTALLETRLIWGSGELFGELNERYRRDVAKGRGADFIEGKLAERDVRHRKMGDSRYLLEPNIKEGKGGLRDLHTLIWLCRFLHECKTLSDLIELGVLTKSDVLRFSRSRLFLWTVRCHLHYITGRAEERLTFDVQPRLATAMGYRERKRMLAVERFMKRYYLVAKDVGALTRTVCAALEDRYQRRPRFSLSLFGLGTRRIDGFVIQGGRISIEDETMFLEQPVQALKLFRLAQERKLDIHPKAMSALGNCLSKITIPLRNDVEANRLFVEILTSKNAPAQALARMNEAGLLGRLIPPFGRIVAQMQHNLYHSYTVDEHTIRAIDVLSQIEHGELKDELPLATELVRKILGRRELFVAMLFHDIGKGQEREHSEVGAEIAAKFCPRLGLSADETETVVWLIRYHLYMSGYAFKRDPEDSKTIGDFAAIVDSLERLRLLLILTAADIRAVGPNIWNGWKGQLLRDLYNETAAAIATGDPTGAAAKRIEAARTRLAEALRQRDDWPKEAIGNYLMRHDQRYWLVFPPDEQLNHAVAINEADLNEAALTIRYRIDKFRARTELFVFAGDHPGLFMKLAGAQALCGFSIVDARILTTLDGMALDVIGFQNAESRDAVTDQSRLNRLSTNIEKTLGGTIWLDKALMGKRSQPGRTDVFQVEPRIRIDNEASRTHSVIEINGRDRPGLLYDVSKTLLDLGLVLNSAHISTYGERVVDVFYVKDVFGLKVTHESKRRRIERRLAKAISDGGQTVTVA